MTTYRKWPFLFLMLLAASCTSESNDAIEAADEETQNLTLAGGNITWSGASAKCVDVRNASRTNGTQVQLFSCNGTGAQAWTYVGRQLQVFGSKCLEAAAGAAKGTFNAIIDDCASTNPNQQWTVNGNTVALAGANLCLDLPAGNTANGIGLDIVRCAVSGNQAWNTLSIVTPPPMSSANPFGPRVLMFDPNMSMPSIQATLDSVFQKQQTNQFGSDRYAYMFKPGNYNLDVQVGFYTSVLGLGASPDDVTITGAVRVKASWDNGNGTQNFWRNAENLAIVPTQDGNNNVWAGAQAAGMRRIHVKGNINLWDGGWSSGGFIADSLVDHQIVSGSEQQFLTRNTVLTQWYGGVWNMVFVGDTQAPTDPWSTSPYTVVATTPVIREKPFLAVDTGGNFVVRVPALRQNSSGISWGPTSPAPATLPLSAFYVANSDTDTAATLNAALAAGKHLLLTPGVYPLAASLQVTRPNTIILGIGLPTLLPTAGNAAMTVADVDGASISGILFDAGMPASPTLLQIGAARTGASHAANPTILYDLSCRVGGAAPAAASNCFTVNSDNVILDNVWLWRADHGPSVGWTANPSINGLIVNGDNVTAYGLFVEHFQQYQTLWNGNGGQVYFYQSEIPYDVPNQASWTHDGQLGYASYKVADSVVSHVAQGLGVYCVFYNPVVLNNAIESPNGSGIALNHMTTLWLGVDPNSAIEHIYNGTGAAVTKQTMQARSAN